MEISKAQNIREKVLEKRKAATEIKTQGNEYWWFNYLLRQFEKMDEFNCFSFITLEQDIESPSLVDLYIEGNDTIITKILTCREFDEESFIKLADLFNNEDGYSARYDRNGQFFIVEIKDKNIS